MVTCLLSSFGKTSNWKPLIMDRIQSSANSVSQFFHFKPINNISVKIRTKIQMRVDRIMWQSWSFHWQGQIQTPVILAESYSTLNVKGFYLFLFPIALRLPICFHFSNWFPINSIWHLNTSQTLYRNQCLNS